MAGKKFSLFEVILSVICVVFTIEAAAPASAMGNVQFFWWIFLIITFLLPYGLVVAELGTAFDSEGGLYDWVRLGLGDPLGRPLLLVLLGQLSTVGGKYRLHVPQCHQCGMGHRIFAWGPNCHRACLCVGRHGHGNAAGGRGRLGHGWRRRHPRCSLPPWWESSASGLPATTALPTICRLRHLSPIWETLTH